MCLVWTRSQSVSVYLVIVINETRSCQLGGRDKGFIVWSLWSVSVWKGLLINISSANFTPSGLSLHLTNTCLDIRPRAGVFRNITCIQLLTFLITGFRQKVWSWCLFREKCFVFYALRVYRKSRYTEDVSCPGFSGTVHDRQLVNGCAPC